MMAQRSMMASAGRMIVPPPTGWGSWDGSLDGSITTFRSTTSTNIVVTALSSSSAIVTWEDVGVNDYGFACACTISGTTITWGSPTAFTSSTISLSSVTALSATEALVCFVNKGDSSKIKAVVLSVSGTTITPGSIVTIDANTTGTAVSVTTLSSTKAIVAWQNATSHGSAMVIDISGTTITTNTAFQFNSTTDALNVAIATISSTQAIVVYQDGSGGNGTAQVLDISGSTVTGNTEYVFNSAASSLFSIAHIASGTFVVTYSDGGNSSYSTAQVLSVSGTVVSYGTKVQVINVVPLAGYLAVAKADSSHAFIVYRTVTTNRGTGVVGTISGTTITLGTPVTLQASTNTSLAACNLDATHVLSVLRDSSDSSKGKGKVSSI
jgi:hypothetical protein